MSKVRYHQLTENEKKSYLGYFYSVVALIGSREEAKHFFKDLLSLSEVVMISRRIQVAKMLLEGMTYEEIKKELRVGASTVSQVERWLNNGFGGYKEMIEKYRKKYPEKSDFEKYGFPPFSRGWTRKKYPAYYALSNLFSGKIK